MKVALIYPPSCDPTAPYLSLPTLAAWLRKHGVEVTLVDANLEAWEHALTRERLEALGARIERRIASLEEKPSLSHTEQLAYSALWAARGDAAAVPGAIERALAVLRDRSGERFYDAPTYETAVATVEAAQRVVSAAFAPLSLDFVAYRTPFSLLTGEEIARDAGADRDPFHDYFTLLGERLAREGVDLVGISVAFPGQVQPAYSLAYAMRRALPNAHVTVGGPALTQMLLRLQGEALDKALGPFHSAVVYEGEVALLEMARKIERGEDPAANGRVIKGTQVEDMSMLPSPDFEGMPMDRYLAPELVLPYDPTRGCYWGVCTFCHYGLAEVGTARYRERPVETIVDHLDALSKRYGVRVFYFSQDVFSPRIALKIARALKARGLDLRWGSDMRPERSLSPEKCKELADGGALSTALGVESASPRVLSLIDKGIPVDDVRNAIQNLSRAGVAVEAMCFSDFPTESYREAMDTVRFVRNLKDELSLFILGQFDLTHGSLIAQKPGDFGIGEVWQVEGDELRTGLFFAEKRRSKRPEDHQKLEAAVSELSGAWRLHRYPWAGALSTAHTMLWYQRLGKDVFRRLGPAPAARIPGAKPREAVARFDLEAIAETSAEREAAIWEQLVYGARRVTRKDYRAAADALPHARPAPRKWRFVAGQEPVPVGPVDIGGGKKGKRDRRGRRPSHAANATKP
ncbi:B12-binding domain-containing radical SAM protein [Polyangium aurulentum]|uniref:B12-binding domain-containing radical SAM protein n=1 Tax=Polyangium aurulentum TaxID=2567896 RepID=UPI0010AE262A|nr:radical SAM protein [Polyangium aurulentum]UQA55593.1 B12-binding domain-containing radical SAM protein [Polyangium aurulentum]